MVGRKLQLTTSIIMGFFSKLFGGSSVNLDEIIQKGAVIVDVRSAGEFKNGHVKGSINLPLDSINSTWKKLDKNKPVITCCASGNRSGMAKGILKSHGFEVYNGGGWSGLRKYSK